MTPSPYTPAEPDWASAGAHNFRFEVGHLESSAADVLHRVRRALGVHERTDRSSGFDRRLRFGWWDASLAARGDLRGFAFWYSPYGRERAPLRWSVWVTPESPERVYFPGDWVSAVIKAHARDPRRLNLAGVAADLITPWVAGEDDYALAERLAEPDYHAWEELCGRLEKKAHGDRSLRGEARLAERTFYAVVEAGMARLARF